MRVGRRTVIDHHVVGRSIADKTIQAREPQLLNLPIPPLPIVSNIIGPKQKSSPPPPPPPEPAPPSSSGNGNNNGNNGNGNGNSGNGNGNGGKPNNGGSANTPTAPSGTNTGSSSVAGSSSGVTPASGGTPNNSPATGGGSPPTGGGSPPTGGGSPPTSGGSPPTGGGSPPTGDGSPTTGGGSPTTGDGSPTKGDGTPTTGGGTTSSGSPSPSTGSVLAAGGGGTPTNSSGSSGSGNTGNGANGSSPALGGVANASKTGVLSNASPGKSSNTPGASSPGGDGSNPATSANAASRHISTGAVAAIVVILISIFLVLLVFFLRRRSKARRNEQANRWWFSRRRTSQTYGDRNSTEILAGGARTARSSFATTVDHSYLSAHAPSLPSLPPMAEVGRANASALPLVLDASHFPKDATPDIRFSIGSNHSENSQYLFVNIRHSLQDLTPMTDEPSPHLESFAFPKPPSPIGDRASAYSRPSSKGTMTASMKRPNTNESLLDPMIPAAGLTGADPFAANPFGDNNPFEDQPTAAQGITPAAFAEREVIRRPFQRTLQDEITVEFGECVRVLMTFDDGWAYVVKIPSLDGDVPNDATKGLIPIDCLREPGQDLPTFISSKRLSFYAAAEGGNSAV